MPKRTHRPLLIWIALLALVVGMLQPGWAMSMGRDGGGPFGADVCRTSATAPADGSSPQPAAGGTLCGHCALCATLTHTGPLPVEQALLHRAGLRHALVAAISLDTAPSQVAWARLPARAPPAFA